MCLGGANDACLTILKSVSGLCWFLSLTCNYAVSCIYQFCMCVSLFDHCLQSWLAVILITRWGRNVSPGYWLKYTLLTVIIIDLPFFLFKALQLADTVSRKSTNFIKTWTSQHFLIWVCVKIGVSPNHWCSNWTPSLLTDYRVPLSINKPIWSTLFSCKTWHTNLLFAHGYVSKSQSLWLLSHSIWSSNWWMMSRVPNC